MRKKYHALICVAVALLLLVSCGEEDRIATSDEMEVGILNRPIPLSDYDYSDYGYFRVIKYSGYIFNTSEYKAPVVLLTIYYKDPGGVTRISEREFRNLLPRERREVVGIIDTYNEYSMYEFYDFEFTYSVKVSG